MPETINIYGAELRRPATVVVDSNAPFVPRFLEQAVVDASTRVEVVSRVQGRHLLLQNQSRTRGRTRTKKNKGKQGIKVPRLRPESWRLPGSETKFEAYVPLHRLWLGYISELLGLEPQPAETVTEQNVAMPNVVTMCAKLVKADFHGSILTVRQSKNPCLVGLSGIVIYESENAFRVITRGNKTKMLPKQNSVFGICVPLYSAGMTTTGGGSGEGGTVSDVPHGAVELYGNQFRFRSSDRASRKFKHKESIVLNRAGRWETCYDDGASLQSSSTLLPPEPLPPPSPLSSSLMSDTSPPIICFSSSVKGMDDWASRTGIPLTSADALGTTYARAHRWLLRLKSDLVKQHGWRDVSPPDSRMLFTIECPSPFKSPNGLPRTPALRIEIPIHATSFFSPERRVQWEMVFHGSAFPALRHNTPVGDILNILQCLLTGMIVIVREEHVPGEGLYKTSRALPPADWVSQNQTGLTEIFGPSHYKSLFKAASDTTKAFRLENHPNKR